MARRRTPKREVKPASIPPVSYCRVAGCENQSHGALPVCRRHWRVVPEEIKREVHRTYLPAFSIGGDRKPCRAGRKAARRAVRAAISRDPRLSGSSRSEEPWRSGASKPLEGRQF